MDNQEIEDKPTVVMKRTGCTLEQAALVLDHCDGDVEKAIELIVSVEKFIFAIKGRFISQSMNARGIFAIIANVKDNRVERIGLLATDDNNFYLPDVNGKWSEFEEGMYIRKLGDGVNQGMSRDMQENVQTMIDNEKDKFFQMLRNMEVEKVEEAIGWEIDRAIKKLGNMEVKINVEQINLYEFKGIEKDEQRKKDEESKGEADSDSSMEVNLQVNLTLAPVDGVQVSELKNGDLVEAVVVDSRDVAYHLASAFGGVKWDEFVPVTALVDDLAPSESGQTKLTVRLYKDIVGNTAIANDVKVKLIAKAAEGEESDDSPSGVNSKSGMSVAVFLIGGTVVLLALVGIFFFFVFR